MDTTISSAAATDQPPTDRLPAPVVDLLAAVREALDIPHPATLGDSERHAEILAERVSHAVIALCSVLDGGPSLGIEWTTSYLREQLAKVPATGYRAWGESR